MITIKASDLVVGDLIVSGLMSEVSVSRIKAEGKNICLNGEFKLSANTKVRVVR